MDRDGGDLRQSATPGLEQRIKMPTRLKQFVFWRGSARMKILRNEKDSGVEKKEEHCLDEDPNQNPSGFPGF
jgi:hypothetical protein